MALALLCSMPLAACGETPAVTTVDRPAPQRLNEACLRPADAPAKGSPAKAFGEWASETWQRGHDCADKVDCWIAWQAKKDCVGGPLPEPAKDGGAEPPIASTAARRWWQIF